MPSNQLQTNETQTPVLSRAAHFPGLAGKLAPVGKVRELYQRVQSSPQGFRLENLLAEMRIDLRLRPSDVARIPAAGPVIVVANHPYGVLDGALLTVLLNRVRPDVKVLTNFLLGDVPELRANCIYVDPFHTDQSGEANRKAAREAMTWLQQGGMLAMFPSGEVSQWQMPAAQVADPAWSDTAVRFIRRTGATALPVYFCGHNNVGFQLLGMLHPKLRTAFLLQEFLTQEGKAVEVRVGSPVPADAIRAMADDHEAMEYLRWRTYLLGRRRKAEPSWPTALRSKLVSKIQEPVAAPVAQSVLAGEIEKLSKEKCLAENSEFSVHLGMAREIPELLLEVGRLRELTFRRAAEGTGRGRDLDSFDDYYWHVLLWNKAKKEVVGAYRAGNTAEILAERGVSGLYTSTLFRYDEHIFQKLGPALELGRSFVRPEYQRQYAPLLLLWKGIARLVATRPETPVLFGAVSISNNYNQASREMIYSYFESRMQEDDLAGLIEPRRPFRLGLLRRWDCRAMCGALRDLDELSEPINDVEVDGKGLPILLRQYAKIGGKLLGFNVDRKFSNVLDGLVVVDLRQTDPTVLERYMGREAAQAFRKIHGVAT
ncbi:MAG TPA: GNAT family N-acyltransferase [Candidatus Dormibacteraeota bacterium]|nr:GNAT family N-acyltransferase [Candidatus Dormibacteraeota bacterium]